MQRVNFLLLSLILNIFGIVPILAEEILHIPQPRIEASGQTYYIDGYGPLVEDIIHSDAYGTKGTPGKKMGGGQTGIPFSELEEATYAHFQMNSGI